MPEKALSAIAFEMQISSKKSSKIDIPIVHLVLKNGQSHCLRYKSLSLFNFGLRVIEKELRALTKNLILYFIR